MITKRHLSVMSRFGVVIVAGFLVAGSQLALSGTWLASTAGAQGAPPDACTLVPAARINIAIGAPAGTTVAGTLNQDSTASSCTFTYDSASIDENLGIQIYPASQYGATVKANSEYGKPTHPAGTGPRSVYFFNADGNAIIIFVKGPYMVEVSAGLGPTHAAIVAGARRVVSLAPFVYAAV